MKRKSNKSRARPGRNNFRRVPSLLGVVRVPRNRSVIPNIIDTKVVYAVNYAGGAGQAISPLTTVFRFTGNSVFNPDLNAALENYPIGVAQWANLYTKFQVYASKITVRVISNTPGGVDGGCQVIIFPHPYTTQLPPGATDAVHFVGQPFATLPKLCGPAEGMSRNTLTNFQTTTQMLARPGDQLFNSFDTSGYIVDSAYQPNSQWFWSVVVTNLPPGATFSDAIFCFEVTYSVRFYQPRLMTIALHSTAGAYVPDPKDPEPPCCAMEPLTPLTLFENESKDCSLEVVEPAVIACSLDEVPERDTECSFCLARRSFLGAKQSIVSNNRL